VDLVTSAFGVDSSRPLPWSAISLGMILGMDHHGALLGLIVTLELWGGYWNWDPV